MTAVRGAVALLTRFPVGSAVSEGPGAAAFGVVGAVVGGIGAVPLVVLGGPGVEPWLGALAAVAVMALVSGGLHLDGLADTADALMASDGAAAERARKDPALGTAGVAAIVLTLGAEVAALGSLVVSTDVLVGGAALVTVAAVSRAVPVLMVRIAPRLGSAPASGLGSWFAARVSTIDVVSAIGSAVVVAAGIAVIGGESGRLVAAGALAGGVLATATATAIVVRRGGLDGDGSGAIVELSMVAGLVVTALLAI